MAIAWEKVVTMAIGFAIATPTIYLAKWFLNRIRHIELPKEETLGNMIERNKERVKKTVKWYFKD